MLGIELTLTMEERVLLAVIREHNNDGFLEYDRLAGLVDCLNDNRGLMSSVFSLCNKGLIFFGDVNKVRVVYLLPWKSHKNLIPEGFYADCSSPCVLSVTDSNTTRQSIGPHSYARSIMKIAATDNLAVETLYEYWKSVFHSRKQMSNEDRLALVKLLKEHSEAEIELAINGLSLSEWHRGENPQGIKYISLRHVAKNFDMCLQLHHKNGA